MQWASDVIVDWSREWLMQLSVSKCSVTLFSCDVRDREMRELSVFVLGSELRREKSPRFLGVTYDVGFTFREHVGRVVSKAHSALVMLYSALVIFYILFLISTSM